MFVLTTFFRRALSARTVREAAGEQGRQPGKRRVMVSFFAVAYCRRFFFRLALSASARLVDPKLSTRCCSLVARSRFSCFRTLRGFARHWFWRKVYRMVAFAPSSLEMTSR